MNRPDDEIGLNIMESWAGEVIETFLKSSDYVFECSEIVGRKFETIDEHAGYLRPGGCEEIIATLAAQ